MAERYNTLDDVDLGCIEMALPSTLDDLQSDNGGHHNIIFITIASDRRSDPDNIKNS